MLVPVKCFLLYFNKFQIDNNNILKGKTMIKKTKIALGVATTSLTMAGALVSPQVLAQTGADLQDQMNEMAVKMEAMQSELDNVRTSSTSGVSSSTSHSSYVASKDHIFSVRGGWMHMNNHRGSTAGPGDSGVGIDILTSPVDDDAFYYGGAIDFNMNNDFFGLMDGVSFGIELGIEYSELGDKKTSGLTPAITAVGAAAPGEGFGSGAIPGGTSLQQNVTVNMLRVSAAPKVKFMHGSAIRPWIIPVGIDFNIISPPSDAVTVLNTGMQFGAGVDIDLFSGIVAGLDGRYHYTPDNIDGVDTDGFTLGGSIGFRF
jgi:opacity protein-like surface antigen